MPQFAYSTVMVLVAQCIKDRKITVEGGVASFMVGEINSLQIAEGRHA